MATKSFIKWFDEVSMDDIALVGGKNASLGEMIQNLKSSHVVVPNGFAITTKAYEHFLKSNNLKEKILSELKNLSSTDFQKLNAASKNIQKEILAHDLTNDLAKEIKESFEKLKGDKKDFSVAARSSASAEDLPNASFAGQQDTFLHVQTFEELLSKIKDVYASMFSERAISYRIHNKFSHEDVLMSVGIQEMVKSDNGSSGVMFTIDPETGFKDVIFINAGYGLGESVVQGSINPDEFIIYKPAAKKNVLAVLNKRLGSKAKKLVFDPAKSKHLIKEEPVKKALQEVFCLNDEDLKVLAKAACNIEEHYKKPMDIEWAKDSNGKIFILQARPETVHGQNKEQKQAEFFIDTKSKILCEGRAVGKSIGQGLARVLDTIAQAGDFEKGQVLITDMTDPNWEPIMQKASAIVTNRGGRTCHAAIIARELGIAAVVGTNDATKKVPNQKNVTVSCAEGDEGLVYEGLLDIKMKEHIIGPLKALDTNLMLIAANPQKAFSYHTLPHKGIGLVRLEFIIANSIGIHPCAILTPQSVPKLVREEITKRARNFSSQVDFYIETLAQGIATLASVASPYPAIVRLSDFKTNEYEELLGGNIFEHKENNPMIGFRGATRYISPMFKDAFKLECIALKKVHDEFGMKNVEVMVPFCRTLNEAESIIKLLDEAGISKSKGYKIIMMCEIPSNVILADEFLNFFDGFSIGSNDLTQLTLGVDRDSHLVAHQFNETDKAVLKMLEIAIDACKKQNKYVGICGQGPSDNIEFAKWLIKNKIDSISLTPDTLLDAYMALAND